MTERVIVTVWGGLVSEVKIPDYADIEVEVKDYDTQDVEKERLSHDDDDDGNYVSEVHVNPIGFKIVYKLSTEDIRCEAEEWENYEDEELTEKQIEYLTGEAGQRAVMKGLEYGLEDWDECIREGIRHALEDYEESEKVTA